MSVILNPAGVGQTDSPRTFALPLGCHANMRVSQSRFQRGRKQSLQSHLIEIFIRTPAPMAEPAPAAAAALTGDTGGRKKSTGQEPAANKKKIKKYPTICRYEFLCLFLRPKTIFECVRQLLSKAERDVLVFVRKTKAVRDLNGMFFICMRPLEKMNPSHEPSTKCK